MIKYLAGESRQTERENRRNGGTSPLASRDASVALESAPWGGRGKGVGMGVEREKRREAGSRVTVDAERGCFTSERGTRSEYTMRSECRVIFGRAYTSPSFTSTPRTRRGTEEGAARSPI
jgi:hypothetical protein